MLEDKKKKIKKLTEVQNNKEMLITEYIETGEGDGISIIPLHEKEKNIDLKNKTIISEKLI